MAAITHLKLGFGLPCGEKKVVRNQREAPFVSHMSDLESPPLQYCRYAFLAVKTVVRPLRVEMLLESEQDDVKALDLVVHRRSEDKMTVDF